MGAIEQESPPGAEQVKSKDIKVPNVVSDAVREKHEETCIPFRSWCKYCVDGKKQEDPHWRKNQEEDGAVTDPAAPAKIQFDHPFPSVDEQEDEEEPGITVLTGWDHKRKALLAIYARVKGGADAYQVDGVKHFVQENGHANIIAMTDPEPSTVNLAERVAAERAHDTILRASPVRSKGSLGGAENANKIVEKELRTQNAKLSERLGVRLTKSHVLTPWAVRHTAWAYNRFQTGEDGRSAWQRSNGRPYVGGVAQFAEKVQFRDGRDKGKLEGNWPEGLWVGKTTLDDSHIVLTEDGVKTARSIARMSPDKRWDKAFLERVRGTPWNPRATEARETLDAGAAALHRPASRRRLYITQEIVRRHGKSRRCGACRGEVGAHSEVCRTRLTALMEKETEEKRAAAAAVVAAEPVDLTRGVAPAAAPAAEQMAEEPAPKAGAVREEPDVEMTGEEAREERRERDKKRPRFHGMDDEMEAGDEDIASMFEIEDEETMRDVCAILDELDDFDANEKALNQPESIDPAKVKAARAVEGDRLLKHKVYVEFEESDYNRDLDGEIVDAR